MGDDALKSLGGEWYELPNGERQRGIAAARARLAELEAFSDIAPEDVPQGARIPVELRLFEREEADYAGAVEREIEKAEELRGQREEEYVERPSRDHIQASSGYVAPEGLNNPVPEDYPDATRREEIEAERERLTQQVRQEAGVTEEAPETGTATPAVEPGVTAGAGTATPGAEAGTPTEAPTT